MGLLKDAQNAEADASTDKDLEKAVLAAQDILYEPESLKSAMEAIAGGNPARAAATLTAALIAQVDDKSGNNMPEDVVIPAAVKVMDELMAYAEKKGVHDFTPEEEKAAVGALMQNLADQFGAADPEMIQTALQEGAQAGGVGKEVESVAKSMAATLGGA